MYKSTHLINDPRVFLWKEITGNEIILDYQSILFEDNPHNPDLLLKLCIIIIKRMIHGSHYNIINISYFKQL